MAKQVQYRRGTTVEHSAFAGALGEITVDTTKSVVVVHNGVTLGGFPGAQAADITAANLNLSRLSANLAGLRSDIFSTYGNTAIGVTNANVAAANLNIATLFGVTSALQAQPFLMANYQQWTSNVSSVGDALNQIATRLKLAGY